MRLSLLMKTTLVVLTCATIMSFAASQAANLSFESGLQDWTVTGKAAAVAAKASQAAKGGAAVAELEASAKIGAAAYDSIDKKRYDEILNIKGTRFEVDRIPNTLTVIEQVLTFAGKSRLYVDANAFHNGDTFAYAQIVLMDASGNRITVGPGAVQENALVPSSDGWAYELGWRTFLLNVESAGDYTLFASVFTYGAKDEPVSFKVDNIRWEADPDLPTAVDEPINQGGGKGGAVIGAMAFLLLAAMGRKPNRNP